MKRFDSNLDYSEFEGWISFERKDIEKVLEKLGDKFDYDKWISVRLNDTFLELMLCSDENLSQVKILRHVLAPYVKDGQPRNWFKGKNNEPLRWTGISNIFYLNGDDAENALEALLNCLETGTVDEKYLRKVDDFYGFCPIKKDSLLI